MTYEEMRDVVDDIVAAGAAAGAKGDKVLHLVPGDDSIVGELYALFSAAADEFEALKLKTRRNADDYSEIIAAAVKVRDATLAWARYVEAVAAAPEKSIGGRTDAILEQLHARGLIVDSGERRWSPKKHCDVIVWIAAPGLPPDYDAGSDDANAVLDFIRECS